MGCIVYSPHWLRTFLLSSLLMMGKLYTCIIRGAFGVARFYNPGNAKALTRGTSGRLAPRFLLVYIESLYFY